MVYDNSITNINLVVYPESLFDWKYVTDKTVAY